MGRVLAAKSPYVPTYTLHDMQIETGTVDVPAFICTGCQHPIPAPKVRGAHIQCRDCGKKMKVVNINPAAQATHAGR